MNWNLPPGVSVSDIDAQVEPLSYHERAVHLLRRIDERLGIWRFDTTGCPLPFTPKTKREAELVRVYDDLCDILAPDPQTW